MKWGASSGSMTYRRIPARRLQLRAERHLDGCAAKELEPAVEVEAALGIRVHSANRRRRRRRRRRRLWLARRRRRRRATQRLPTAAVQPALQARRRCGGGRWHRGSTRGTAAGGARPTKRHGLGGDDGRQPRRACQRCCRSDGAAVAARLLLLLVPKHGREQRNDVLPRQLRRHELEVQRKARNAANVHNLRWAHTHTHVAVTTGRTAVNERHAQRRRHARGAAHLGHRRDVVEQTLDRRRLAVVVEEQPQRLARRRQRHRGLARGRQAEARRRGDGLPLAAAWLQRRRRARRKTLAPRVRVHAKHLVKKALDLLFDALEAAAERRAREGDGGDAADRVEELRVRQRQRDGLVLRWVVLRRRRCSSCTSTGFTRECGVQGRGVGRVKRRSSRSRAGRKERGRQ
jgi:hypothetical protein